MAFKMEKIISVLLLVLFVFNTSIKAQQIIMPQTLSIQQESIVPIAAYTANGDQRQLKTALYEGLNAHLSINEINEILIQLYAYAGFPRSLNAISTFESVLMERKQKGITDSVGRAAAFKFFPEGKFAYGKNIQTILTGTTAIGAPQKFVPVIDTFLKEHLFADIFERDVLAYAQRELVTISVIATIGNADPMLQSHFGISLNAGISPQQLQEFISVIKSSAGKKEAKAAQSVLNKVLKASN